ncbi:hypothetical protein AAMO2058_000252100 [Amorphochlora amoebiformis]
MPPDGCKKARGTVGAVALAIMMWAMGTPREGTLVGRRAGEGVKRGIRGMRLRGGKSMRNINKRIAEKDILDRYSGKSYGLNPYPEVDTDLQYVKYRECDISALPPNLKIWILDANILIKGTGAFPPQLISEVVAQKSIVVTTKSCLKEVKSERSRGELRKLPFYFAVCEAPNDVFAHITNFAKLTGDDHALSDTDVDLLALAFAIENHRCGSSHLRHRPIITRSSNATFGLVQPPGVGSIFDDPNVTYVLSGDGYSAELVFLNQTNSTTFKNQTKYAYQSRIQDLLDSDPTLNPESSVGSVGSVRTNKSRPKPPAFYEVIMEAMKDLLNPNKNPLYPREIQTLLNPSKKPPPNLRSKRAERNRRRKLNLRNRKISIQKDIPISIEKLGALITKSKSEKRESDVDEKDRGFEEGEEAEGGRGGGGGGRGGSRKRCGGGRVHSFYHKLTEDDGYYCDICSETQNKKSPIISCSKCDFDTCLPCFNKSFPFHINLPSLHTEDDSTNPYLDSEGHKKSVLDSNLDSEDFLGPDGNDLGSVLRELGAEDEPQNGEVSNVVSVTQDFSMQNVLLQMGLQVSSPSGMIIETLRINGYICELCEFTAQHVPNAMFCPMCGGCASLWRVPMQRNENGALVMPSKYKKLGRLAVTQNQVLGLASSSVKKLGLSGTPRRRNVIPIACLPQKKNGKFDTSYVRLSRYNKPPSYIKDIAPRPRGNQNPLDLLEDAPEPKSRV